MMGVIFMSMRHPERRKFHFIYRTTCTITGRWYVGMHSTDTIDDNYLGSGKLLWPSIQKHGRENHVREVLEFCSDRKALIKREHRLVDDKFIDDPLCMNLMKGGLGNSPGYVASLQARQRISAALKGRTITVETRQKIRKTRIGKTQSVEANKKTGEATLVRFQDAEFRNKHSEAVRQAMKKVDRSVLQSRQKSVDQYDLVGNFINRFSSISVAAEAVGLSRTMVGYVLNGRAKKVHVVLCGNS